MSTKNIAVALAAAILLLAAGPALAAEPALPAVVSVQAEKGGGHDEFLFTATVTGVPPGDGRYQVLLQLARPNGEFADGVASLFTPLVWNEAAAAWTGTQTVDKFAPDRTRRFRGVIRDTASGAIVAVGQDQTLLQPGKAPAISRQEALAFLGLLADNYMAKNYSGFMKLVSTDFAGDDFILSNAVRKDFQLLNDISLRFTVSSVTGNDYFATVSANYRRSVTPVWTGQRLNDSGVTELALIKEKGKLKLYSMKKPLLFGLANGGAAATGIIASAQNGSVIQIAKDGTVYTGPVSSASVAVRSAVLHGTFSPAAGFSIEDLRLATGLKTANNTPASFDGDVAVSVVVVGTIPNYRVHFNTPWLPLPGVTNINSVTSVPASGYGESGTAISLSPATHLYAVHLGSGKYAVVEITNWSGNDTGWGATVLYKYQSDGTRNF
ncbi:MAG TPA: hypothetical protein VN521_03695 [Negativicutes bacterium]|nr:hypothetical protein [Negativicutes bacterium]